MQKIEEKNLMMCCFSTKVNYIFNSIKGEHKSLVND